MQVGLLSKVTVKSADEVCALAQAGGQPLPDADGALPAAYLERLITTSRLPEAVAFLAYALPKREAVWWACLCARDDLPEVVDPRHQAALEAAEAWVYRPTDELRRAAMARAQETSFDAPAPWTAVAAFWSGESMAPPELPAVPPAPHLLGIAVAGAVTLACVQREPALAEEKRRRYIEVGIDIADGGTGRKTRSE